MLKKKALNRILIGTILVAIVFIVYTIYKIEKKPTNIEYDYISEEDKTIIYLPNKNNLLVECSIYIDNKSTIEDKIKEILESMIEENNKNSLLPSDVKPLLPRNTKINSITIDGDILKIDFSKELMNINDEQSENMISAIVYTITEFKEILGVQISADKNIIKYIPNTEKEMPTVLNRNIGINNTYDITSNNNIKKVILYYYSNDRIVPITKYVNTDKEKIEIIIESLANTIINKDSIASYLDYDLELTTYKVGTNIIELNFNKKIDNDKAIDIITRAVFSNYDIKTIRFLENNHIFLEKNLEI